MVRERVSSVPAVEVLESVHFNVLIDLARSRNLAYLLETFEKNPDYRNNLPYHNSDHTNIVVDRTRRILSLIQSVDPFLVSDRDIRLGELAASFHDFFQDSTFVRGKRRMRIGKNEEKSTTAALEFMEEGNEKHKAMVFGEEDKNIVSQAIMGTIPKFKNGTVYQEHLTSQSSIVALAVGLADLGSAGMDPQKFRYDGDALFKEENLDVLDDLVNGRFIPDDKKAGYRQRMLAWTKSQSQFAEGRKKLLPSEIARLPKSAQERIMALFNRFDESIAMVEALLEERKKMSFEELVKDFGY